MTIILLPFYSPKRAFVAKLESFAFVKINSNCHLKSDTDKI